MKKKIPQILLGIVAALIIISVSCAYTYGAVYFSNHFYPGTIINDIDVSNLTVDETRDLLDAELNSYSLLIIGKDTKDILTAEDVGLAYVYYMDDSDILEETMEQQNSIGWVFTNERASITLNRSYSEDKVNTAIESLSCLHPEEEQAPQDAYLDYQDGKYVIVPEQSGNVVEKDDLSSAVLDALDTLASEISLDGMYPEADVKSDNEFLNLQADNANAILDADVTIASRVHSVKVDRDSIKSFLIFQDDGSVTLDRDVVFDWVMENITGPIYTMGIERTIETPSSGTVTVSGGTYGYWVHSSDETTQLMEDLISDEQVEREPVWRVEENGSTSNDGVGDTYIDVNIDEQMVYVVKDGEIDYSTECVTGSVASGHDTPTGTYYVSWKTTDWTMRTYNSFVNYWMPIDDSTGVGLHDATWRSSFGGSIYRSNGSHGCINLPLDAARYIYNNTDVGIPVIVH